jgi:alkylation response protein AidB-like acyl-CoA dehydrogenase
MQFSFSDEQEQFRDVVRRFATDKSPTTAVRALMATERGYDPEVWQQLSQDLALPGLALPEVYGGSGFGAIEVGIVMEEFGRSLVCAPYFASAVLAARAIVLAADETQKQDLLPPIASGEVIATLAVAESKGAWDENDVELVAERTDGGYTLTGSKRFVLDGHVADQLIVAGRSHKGVSLFAVDPSDASVTVALVDTMDPTRKLTNVTLNGSPGLLLGTEGEAHLDETMQFAHAALANEMVGGAQQLLDTALEYTKLRVQFGRTVASFQAIKHRLADLLLEVELAKSAAYYAAEAIAENDDAAEAASLAKAQASEAYLAAAIQCIQLHGGIGFTWENDTHLWFKRAKSSEVFLGSPHEHRERMMQAMGV